MLSAKPRKSKYTVGDTVYHYNNGAIETLTIKKVIVNVTNPNDTTNGIQINKYGFLENDRFYLEEDLYVKPNALLQRILQPDRNHISGYMQHLILSGQYEGFTSGFVTKDLTGVSMEDSTVDEAEAPDYTGCFVDNASFHNWAASWIPSRLQFIEDVASYDKKYTKWEGQFPISDLRGLTVVLGDSNREDIFTGCLLEGTIFRITNMAAHATKSEILSWAESYDELTTIWADYYPVIDCRNIVFTGNLNAIPIPNLIGITIMFDVTDRKFEGADFTGCTMPTNADTKAEFKALAGSWDAVTTIWTDGLPIGS